MPRGVYLRRKGIHGVYQRTPEELRRLREMARRAGTIRGVQVAVPQGTRRYEKSGYVVIKTPAGMMYEHRWVMEQHLGRSLLPNEHVHHINWDKRDNRIENLLLTERHAHRAHHRGQHYKETGIRSVMASARPRDTRGRFLPN